MSNPANTLLLLKSVMNSRLFLYLLSTRVQFYSNLAPYIFNSHSNKKGIIFP